MEQKIYGGIELGGTKTICAIASADGQIINHTLIPTTSVHETFKAIYKFFRQNNDVASLGVGSFGPINLASSSAKYGQIYNSPKPGWANVDIKGLLEENLGLSVVIDTDVNCAALGELYYGVARHVRSFIYLTLGTGIGGSMVSDGQVIHGILNLEMGHMRIPHEPFSDRFGGVCVFHGDCWEGIASGPAMSDRYGTKPEEINNVEAWEKEASYIATALNNLMMTFGPELIVLGGGLMNHEGLIEDIRLGVQRNVNNYLDFPALDRYIVRSSGDKNSVLGAIKMAALKE